MKRKYKTGTGTIAVCVVMLFQIAACDSNSDDVAWKCDVTVTLTPSTLGNLSSPSGTGRASATGDTQDEALGEALDRACSDLETAVDLDNAAARQCRDGESFSVEGGGSGNVRLLSAGAASWDCGTQ